MVFAGVLPAGMGLAATLVWSGSPLVPYPEGYRDWTHVKSMVILEGHALYDSFGGIHHIYANGKALKAMKDARPYPDGSVLIFDLLEPRWRNMRSRKAPGRSSG